MTSNKKKKRRSARQKHKGISTVHILIVAGAAMLVVGLLVILNTNHSQATRTDPITYETGVTLEGEPYKGSPDAPLQLVEYSDFLCGHCGNFADTIEAIGPDYIETGELQVIFRNYAFLAPESIEAAQAAECALDQGADKFWLYHDLLFANRGTGISAYSNSRLKAYARDIGLDTRAFNQCLDSDVKLEVVQADKAEGESQGVQATPTWFINGQIVRGGVSETELRQTLDSLLTQVP